MRGQTELFKCFSLKSFLHLQVEQHDTMSGDFWGLQEMFTGETLKYRWMQLTLMHLIHCNAESVQLPALKNKSKQNSTLVFLLNLPVTFFLSSFLNVLCKVTVFLLLNIFSYCIVLYNCFHCSATWKKNVHLWGLWTKKHQR